MRLGTQAGAQQMSQRIELWQKLELLWDDPGKDDRGEKIEPWTNQLNKIAETASNRSHRSGKKNSDLSKTQAKGFENICYSAKSYSDVFNYIYAQMGKDRTEWEINSWPDDLLKLLHQIKSVVIKNDPGGGSLDDRIRRQTAVLMLFKKAGKYFAAYMSFFEKYHSKSKKKTDRGAPKWR